MMIRNILIIIGLAVLFSACGKNVNTDIVSEDYDKLFPYKKPDSLDNIYEDMVVYNCDPNEKDEDFKYPGVIITDEIRRYKVELYIYFMERNSGIGGGAYYSDLNVSYISKNKKRLTLRSRGTSSKVADLTNGEAYKLEFSVESGFPLYLSVTGAGFNSFRTLIYLKAMSEDGLIKSPELRYEVSTYADGAKELEPYCKKVILP